MRWREWARQQLCDVVTKVSSRRWFWRIGLLVLFVLPLLPEIVTLTISAIAEVSGCQVDDEKVCAVGPISSVSSVIHLALRAGFLVGVSFGSGVAAVWLALCYVSIVLGWTGLSSRLMLAFSVSLIFAFVPYFGPMLSIGHLVNPNCSPNEGRVGPCVVYGGNVGSVAHDTVFLSWWVFRGAPVALAAFGLYVLFVLRRAKPSV